MLISESAKTIKLAWPIIIGQLSQIALGVIDSVMVGDLGAQHLAAVSVSISVFSVLLVFGLGISFAISPLTAIAQGEFDTQKINDVMRSGFWTLTGVGIALALVTFFSANLIPYFKQDPEVSELAGPYIQILSYSMLPILVYQHFKQFSEGLQIMWPPLIVGLAMIPLNIFGNWLLIYGNLGFPEMGLNGAGWATTLSRLIATTAMFAYSLNSKRLKRYTQQLFNIYLVKKSMVTRILKLGVPGGFQYIFETSAFALSALIIGYIGAQEQAAHQITINLASISFMVAVGLSSASAIRIGHAKGQGNYHLAKRIGYSSFLSSALFMAACGIVFIIGSEYLPSLYINDQEVIQISSQLMLIAALFQIADGIQAVGVGILRGLEDVKRPTLFVLIAYWGIALPLGALFAFVFHWGVLGIWAALALGLFISAILLSWRFSKQINRLIQ